LDINSDTVTRCTPQFNIVSPAGCVGGVYKTSLGFVTWVMILGIIYLGIGTFLNIKQNGKRGMEAIPHIEAF